MEHLKDFDFSISDRLFNPGARYTRIFTKYPRFEDWDNKESTIQKMDDLYCKSAKKSLDTLLDACRTFNWVTDE